MGDASIDEAVRHDFETVDHKIAEAEFFLQRMAGIGFDTFTFNCYFSAYLCASRTATLALQRFRHLPGFDEWYAPHRLPLKADKLAKLFLDLRNAHIHGGPYPVTRSVSHQGRTRFGLDRSINISGSEQDDVVSICRNHFILLLEIVYDCYVQLGIHIDPQQRYTREHYATLGKTIDDAEVEIWGWIRTSPIEDGLSEDDRWDELRGHVGECTINHLFYSYLGTPTPQPLMPEEFADFDYSPEDKGWTHVPAGFASIEAYQEVHGRRTKGKDNNEGT